MGRQPAAGGKNGNPVPQTSFEDNLLSHKTVPWILGGGTPAAGGKFWGYLGTCLGISKGETPAAGGKIGRFGALLIGKRFKNSTKTCLSLSLTFSGEISLSWTF